MVSEHHFRASMEARGRVTSVIPPTEEVYVDHEMSADEAALVALGYKQEFKREFSVWTSFGVSFSVLGLLPSTASTLYVCFVLIVLRIVWIGICWYWRHGLLVIRIFLTDRSGDGLLQ
jgi:hypothetical protein